MSSQQDGLRGDANGAVDQLELPVYSEHLRQAKSVAADCHIDAAAGGASFSDHSEVTSLLVLDMCARRVRSARLGVRYEYLLALPHTVCLRCSVCVSLSLCLCLSVCLCVCVSVIVCLFVCLP